MAQGDINSNERNEAAQDEMLSAILQKLGANTSAGVSPPAQGTVSEPRGHGDQAFRQRKGL